jgi:lipoate-protein ligase A
MTRWRYLIEDEVGAAAGLAFDEALMDSHSRTTAGATPVVRLYTYRSHAALCGRYQNLNAEISLDGCRRSGTAFNRRPTGGGAIVMGQGQLGVAVVTRAPTERRPKEVLLHYSEGIVAGLAKLGIEAVFGGKNDLVVEGRKIAGLGLFLDSEGALLFHSSILADLDIPFMLQVLDIPAAKLGDKAVAAVEQRVTTVTRETGHPWTGASLREVVALGFTEALGWDLAESEPTPGEIVRAAELEKGKFSSDQWLFQRSPQPDATATALLKTPGGLVRLYLALQGDTIKSALFTGDFNDIPPQVTRFEGALKWARAESAELERIAAACFSEGTGLGVEAEVLTSAVLEAADKAATREIAAPQRSGSCYFPEEKA